MVETTTPAVAPQSGDSGSAPAGAPDLSGASLGELEALLGKVSQGGEQAQGTPPQAATGQEGQSALQTPVSGQPGQPAPAGVEIPAKFKNADGTVNTEAWAKSYAEAERQMSQLFQERAELRKVNEQQLSQIREQVEAINAWREEMAQKAEEAQAEPERTDYTPEEIEEMRTNPRPFIQKEAKRVLDSFIKEQKKTQQETLKAQQEEAKINQQINEAINYGRANVEGFKTLEAEIAKIMESPALARHPDAVQIGYYATLGQKVPTIIKEVKNAAFTEGYNKAKEEMGRHVESGGRSTLPMDGGALTKETIDGMSAADLEKLLPKYDRSVSPNNPI